MLNATVVAAPDGVRGIDANTRVSPAAAMALRDHGYGFVIRYIRRFQSHPFDLTDQEANVILSAGLAIGVVQHVESAESWVPSTIKGISFGKTAGQEAQRVGLPFGAQVWCDLEGVAEGTNHRSVIDYGTQWFNAVQSAGFLPCLYVGWHCGLTASELYHDLPFTRYWAAYNLNGDEMPAVRGVCMRQKVALPTDRPEALGFTFDVDVCKTDAEGGQATFVAPEGWLASFTGH